MSEMFDHELDATEDYFSQLDSGELIGTDSRYNSAKTSSKYDDEDADDEDFLYSIKNEKPNMTNSKGFHNKSKTVTCKFCGKNGFTWKQEDTRWFLINSEGESHDCPLKSATANTELEVVKGLVLHYTGKEPERNESMNKMMLRVLVEMSSEIEMLKDELIRKD